MIIFGHSTYFFPNQSQHELVTCGANIYFDSVFFDISDDVCYVLGRLLSVRMNAPSVDEVHKAVFVMFCGSNAEERSAASSYLLEVQKSVIYFCMVSYACPSAVHDSYVPCAGNRERTIH